MDLVKTGAGLTKTIKNVGRLREILSVLATNGFDEFILQTKLHEKIGFVLPRARLKSALSEKRDDELWGSVGYRLRKSFETLGPGFIKLGQLIASREDLFHKDFIWEMKKLQNNVAAGEFLNFENVLKSNLGDNYKELFASFNEKPIATASIGSVFEAKLKTGDLVVAKVRKPNIKEIIDTDFELFKLVISQVERISEDLKYLGLSRMIEDFHRTVLLELNFVIEKKNLIKLKNNAEKIDEKKILKIPEIYEDFCSEEVLVMEYLDGIPFNELGKDKVTPELESQLISCTKMFLKNLLSDGFFHADLHGGNFLLLKDGRIGIIDFGSVGTLSKKNRGSLISILYSLSNNNYENLVYEFLDIAEYDKIPNYQLLTRDIEQNLGPFVGLSAQELNITELMSVIILTLRKHQLYLPREWFIIFRAITTLDGVGKSLGLDLNIFEIIEDDTKDIVEMLVSKDQLMEEGVWFARDLINSFKIFPKHMTWFFKEISKNNYAIEIKSESFSDSVRQMSNALYFLGTTLLFSVLFFSGVFLVKDTVINHLSDIPKMTGFLWFLSLIVLVYMIYRAPNSK